MSLKRLLSAGFAVCVLTSSAMAVPQITITPLPYVAAEGRIKWELRITQNDVNYNGALAVELPLALTPVTPSFVTSLYDSGGDATNGTATTTWYYNETAAGSGNLLWNITDPANAANTTQNVGLNPFNSTEMEGLNIDTVAKRIFAALGSTVNLPDADGTTAGKQVNTIHISSSDGRFTWTDAIVGENGVQYELSGSTTSIIRGDMNGNRARNFLDVAPFGQALSNPAGYAAMFPGLDRVARGDMNANGALNFLDVAAFGACLSNPVNCMPNPTGSGAGGDTLAVGGGNNVPEPGTLALAGLGMLAATGLYRRKRS